MLSGTPSKTAKSGWMSPGPLLKNRGGPSEAVEGRPAVTGVGAHAGPTGVVAGALGGPAETAGGAHGGLAGAVRDACRGPTTAGGRAHGGPSGAVGGAHGETVSEVTGGPA